MKASSVDSIETAPPARRALLVWFGAFGGIGIWIVHLTVLAASVQWAADRPGRGWTLHAVTAGCVLAALLPLYLSRRLYLAAGDASDNGSDDAGQLAFLARLGLLVGAISLLLILVEGSYAVVLHGRG